MRYSNTSFSILGLQRTQVIMLGTQLDVGSHSRKLFKRERQALCTGDLLKF